MGEWRYIFITLDHGPGKEAPGTLWIGGWVEPRVGLDFVVKKKISFPCRESNPGHSPSLYRLNYPDLPFNVVSYFNRSWKNKEHFLK
jgi:hypothetical protein